MSMEKCEMIAYTSNIEHVPDFYMIHVEGAGMSVPVTKEEAEIIVKWLSQVSEEDLIELKKRRGF